MPVPDPDRLAEAETAVLDLLDPPLNLRGRPPTPIRARLAELRRGRQPDPAGQRRRHHRAGVSNQTTQIPNASASQPLAIPGRGR